MLGSSNRFLKLWGILLAPAVFIGCSNSPLFNHKMESDIQSKNNKIVKASSNCKVLRGMNLCLNSTWLEGPIVTKYNSIKLEFYDGNDPDKKLISVKELYVEPWMPEHDHGSSPTEVEILDNGEYLIKEIWFNMPGLWEIRIYSEGKLYFSVEARV